MTIRAWWASDPAETYWMEITDRDDLGGELWAPKEDATGGESWSYTLVSNVQPGDRVFHWHKNAAGVPSLIGWSGAVGPLRSDVRAWQARGTAGIALFGQNAPKQLGFVRNPADERITRPIDDLSSFMSTALKRREPKLLSVFDAWHKRFEARAVKPEDVKATATRVRRSTK